MCCVDANMPNKSVDMNIESIEGLCPRMQAILGKFFMTYVIKIVKTTTESRHFCPRNMMDHSINQACSRKCDLRLLAVGIDTFSAQ